ncbi:GAK system ATP-grasp enzyme [Desulfovermiculus halophilus]|jgi:ribosomal protein S6--L-glutamate ligase|uniref:GAK system ATP-grasp enzyme n=1 Tax=Desulfovermiculus halophilus TaxID=339722 RepID=UPI000489D22A|nr:GAK system ATP-grasp enzyme [Desulfovermiculus halophilus]
MWHIGVVGTPGGRSSEWLADEVRDQTGHSLLVDMTSVTLDLSRGTAFFRGRDLLELDGLIVKKIGSRYSPDLLDRLEMLRFLHRRGLPIFSPPESMMRVVDRLSCTVALQLAGIPMPPTVVTEDIEEAKQAVRRFGQAVLKPLYTSKARGMRVIGDTPDLDREMRAYSAENAVIYIQKKIDLNGRDLGLVFLGGEYLTTYARCNPGPSWNTSTASGGRYQAYAPSRGCIDLASKAQGQFDLDFTCVDVAETEDGPVVFEVSAFGGFRGVWEAQGLNAARMFTSYVMQRIRAGG